MFHSFMFLGNVIKQMVLALLLKLCVSQIQNLSSSSSNYSHILTHKHPIVIVYIYVTAKERLSTYLFQLYTMQSQIGRFSLGRRRLSFIENLVEDLVLGELNTTIHVSLDFTKKPIFNFWLITRFSFIGGQFDPWVGGDIHWESIDWNPSPPPPS